MNKLDKIATVIAIVGLALLVVVIVSGSTYPSPLFIYGTAIGMLMIFLSAILYVASWCRELFENIKAKNIIGILLLITSAIILIITIIRK